MGTARDLGALAAVRYAAGMRLLRCLPHLVLLAGVAWSRAETVYDDALGRGWSNWSWDGDYSFTNGSPADGEGTAIRVQQSPWGALSLRHASLPADGYRHLEFLIHGGLSGGQRLDVMLEDESNRVVTARLRVEDHVAGGGGVQSGAWRRVIIPLAAFRFTSSSFARIDVQNRGQEASGAYYIDNFVLTPGSSAVPGPATIRVDAKAGVHPISPLIYGVAWAPSPAALRSLGATVHRWGGNHTSTYNWMERVKNTGNDWYFENTPWGAARFFEPVDDGLHFVTSSLAAGAQPILTVPLLPFVARDGRAVSFSVAKYGPQEATDPWRPDAGNGIVVAGTNRAGVANDPLDSGVPSRARPRSGDPAGTVYVDAWLRHLQWFAGSFPNPLPFVALDNELDIWAESHRDWHPQPTTYDEAWCAFTNYAAMVRAVSPRSRILAPVSCGWWYYWNSAAGADDKAAHGGQDFLPWFLDRARDLERRTGLRVCDMLDVHYYPESFRNPSSDPANAARRLRSTRDLWDWSYTNEGWIGTDRHATATQPSPNCPAVIPRLKALIDRHYPGLPLALTEYNWGSETNLNGALALADCLGILGREGVDLACYWTYPAMPAGLAFRLYRCGEGGAPNFGDVSCAARTADPDEIAAYAATHSADDSLSLVAINKHPRQDCLAQVVFTNFVPAATAAVYRLSAADAGAVRREADLTNAAARMTVNLPAYSATLLRLRPQAAPRGPGRGSGQ